MTYLLLMRFILLFFILQIPVLVPTAGPKGRVPKKPICEMFEKADDMCRFYGGEHKHWFYTKAVIEPFCEGLLKNGFEYNSEKDTIVIFSSFSVENMGKGQRDVYSSMCELHIEYEGSNEVLLTGCEDSKAYDLDRMLRNDPALFKKLFDKYALDPNSVMSGGGYTYLRIEVVDNEPVLVEGWKDNILSIDLWYDIDYRNYQRKGPALMNKAL